MKIYYVVEGPTNKTHFGFQFSYLRIRMLCFDGIFIFCPNQVLYLKFNTQIIQIPSSGTLYFFHIGDFLDRIEKVALKIATYDVKLLLVVFNLDRYR